MKNRVKFIALSVIFATQSFAETKTDGFELGIGIHVGSQKTSRKNDSCFAQDQKSIKSVVFGGSVSIGYVKKIGNSFGLGFDIGADFGKSAKQLKTSGYLASNSEIYNKVNDATGQIVKGLVSSFSALRIISTDPEPDYVATEESLKNIVNVMRYIGGSNSDQEVIREFVESPKAEELEIDDMLNENATFENFYFEGATTTENLKKLSNGTKLDGLKIVREYVTKYCPNGALLFNHILEKGGNLAPYQADFVSLALNDGVILSGSYADVLGINADSFSDVSYPMYFFKNVLNPDSNQEFANNAIKEIKYNLKSSFNISPNIGIKFGVYVNDGRSFFYIKPGITQLNGRIVAAENNEFGIKNKKFNKITPMFSIGYDQRIGNSGWGVGFEVSHAFKTSKKLDSINVLGTTFTPEKSIHRTCVRFLLIKIF